MATYHYISSDAQSQVAQDPETWIFVDRIDQWARAGRRELRLPRQSNVVYHVGDRCLSVESIHPKQDEHAWFLACRFLLTRIRYDRAALVLEIPSHRDREDTPSMLLSFGLSPSGAVGLVMGGLVPGSHNFPFQKTSRLEDLAQISEIIDQRHVLGNGNRIRDLGAPLKQDQIRQLDKALGCKSSLWAELIEQRLRIPPKGPPSSPQSLSAA